MSNKTHHTNYCRQMAKWCSAFLKVPSLPPAVRADYEHAVSLAAISTKFMLPDDRDLIEDPDFRGFDEGDELRLPYKAIALEYRPWSEPDRLQNKFITFAVEHDDGVYFWEMIYMPHDGKWLPSLKTRFPRTGFLERPGDGMAYMRYDQADDDEAPPDIYQRPASRLLSFLNALQCSNVHIERSEPSATHKALAASKRSALPFDTYHILTIDLPARLAANSSSAGPHRSPREHLRRGHIRRLDDGRRIWINATVVNAGIGGRVSKDYRLRQVNRS